MERVVTESQFVSLQLKTAYDDNGYLRQALKEANKELSAKAEVCWSKTTVLQVGGLEIAAVRSKVMLT